ncbi:hypothetical protein L2E82_19761 [Cichorium intybus]|uniref:Uncharacterized protein n=1 Tax=Cichorium intybus TaxID=13427 RepID=A0ACB9DR14_CICIN|nr:hypothetical protein L1887_21100 [Cichorium endivia]KAI3749154.1 hypothetical protein L2E82_19761 [Cichorium intybus]
MANHLVQAILSLGLSIAVILCIVALVARNNYLDDDDLVNTKAVYTMCKPVEYKDACKAALHDVALNTSSTKKDYLFAPFNSTLTEIKNAINKTASVRKALDGRSDAYAKTARSDLKSCEKLLGHAAEELHQVVKVANKTKIATLAEQGEPMMIWITAIRAYQTTCVEEIQDGNLKKQMKKELENASKHTFNLEKIVYNIADILLDFGVDLGHFHIHRRLLDDEGEEEEEGDSDNPTWLSASDRTLLGGDDKEDEDEEEDDDKKKDKGGYFKKYTSQDYCKTPKPDKIKKDSQPTPNVVVAKDSRGDVNTIKKALEAYPKNHQGRYVVYVMAGVYDEGQIIVNKKQCNVYMYGDGPDKTIITGDLSQAKEQLGASQTATFVAEGERFVAKSIGFKNTAGADGSKAVAFRSQATNAVMVDCSFESNQNTIYYHAHDQFYKNCTISGTVDIITGSGRAYFQDCQIFVRKPEKGQTNYITADGKMKDIEAAGVVIQKTKMNATKELEDAKGEVKTYLGRPWKAEATVVVMQCYIGDFMQPQGWSKSDSSEGKNYHKTCTFREYGNKGPGSDMDERVKWKGFKALKNKKYAGKFTPDPFMKAKSWLPNAGVPVEKGFKY